MSGVVVAPDGRLISAGLDNTIRVWDLATGRQRRVIPTRHPVGASILAVSADGRLIATADFNRGVVALHERDSGKAVRLLQSGGVAVYRLAFAPRGKLLAVAGRKVGASERGGGEPFVALVDADSGREVRRFPVEGSSTLLSPDGRLLATLGPKEVRLRETATGQERLTVPRGESYQLAFSGDGRTLAVGGGETTKSVVLWEMVSGKERARLTDVPGDRYAHLCFSPDGRWLALQEDRWIQLWDVRHGKKIHRRFPRGLIPHMRPYYG